MSSLRELHDLLFDVRRSVRYHDKREAFFLSIGNAAHYISFLSGFAAALIIAGVLWSGWDTWMKALVPLVGAMFSGITLVFRVGARASLHKILKQRFISLERKLIACRENQAKVLKRLQRERLKIESEEPPILRVLDTACYNELVHAMDLDKSYIRELTWFQRMCMNFTDVQTKRLYS